jgi:hypothetical protein
MDSIKGAIVLRDRLGHASVDDAKAAVPPEAPPIYHWLAVAPSEAHGATSESRPLDD